jgi:hypothetical protein
VRLLDAGVLCQVRFVGDHPVRDAVLGALGCDSVRQPVQVRGLAVLRQARQIQHQAGPAGAGDRQQVSGGGQVRGGVDEIHAGALGEPYVIALGVEDEYRVARVDPPFGQQPGQVALAGPVSPAISTLPWDPGTSTGCPSSKVPIGTHRRAGHSRCRPVSNGPVSSSVTAEPSREPSRRPACAASDGTALATAAPTSAA